MVTPARTKRDPGHTVQQGISNSRCAGGTANDGNAWRPAKRGETGSHCRETCGTHHVAGLQQSFATSLDKIDARHDFTRKAFCRLGGARGQHYIAGIDGALASGLNISDEREPAVSLCAALKLPYIP